MGRVRKNFPNKENYFSKLFLTEMIARVVKSEINQKIRERMKENSRSVEEKYKVLISEEFNKILDNTNNSDFWCDKIKKLLEKKFGKESLFEEEKSLEFNLRENISSLQFLFKRLFSLIGVQLTKKCERDFLEFLQPVRNSSSNKDEIDFVFIRNIFLFLFIYLFLFNQFIFFILN